MTSLICTVIANIGSEVFFKVTLISGLVKLINSSNVRKLIGFQQNPINKSASQFQRPHQKMKSWKDCNQIYNKVKQSYHLCYYN